MTTKTKKIIAREGLMLICFIAPLAIYALIYFFFLHDSYYADGIYGTLQALVLFGYPLYLLIRFIIWAIKTLRNK